ncbi:Protein disulfide-isomerase A3 [Symbiodinium microadriaticum]|uniref:Protein disulfide-isomerase A3 n=2 Tax=Symbiodinium TaxID=2949 RepID=A0A1Q9E3B5_SYMMI|nr:Protein disulfide-isomerase A3 [Symbiodinium microadriaticum]
MAFSGSSSPGTADAFADFAAAAGVDLVELPATGAGDIAVEPTSGDTAGIEPEPETSSTPPAGTVPLVDPFNCRDVGSRRRSRRPATRRCGAFHHTTTYGDFEPGIVDYHAVGAYYIGGRTGCGGQADPSRVPFPEHPIGCLEVDEDVVGADRQFWTPWPERRCQAIAPAQVPGRVQFALRVRPGTGTEFRAGRSSRYDQKGFFSKADNFIMCVTSILVAGTTLILTNALVWVVLGSLIRPTDLIPYAIMVAAVATMGHSMLSKFRGMKNYCQSQMVDLLDAALVAIFKVMARDKTMMSTVEDRKEKFEALKVQVAKLIPDLDLHVGKAMEKMVRAGRQREGTDEFLSKLHLDHEAGPQDSQARELHMQLATPSAEHKSADKERERKVKKLSKHLALHSKTVELMLDCFENRVVLKRLSDSAAAHSNSSASTLASLVSIARRDCLFGHFLRPLEAPGLPKDAPETEPRVLSLLCHLQNEEMERMDAVVAKCLTQCLDWPRIGREVEFFCSRTLVSRVILNAVERELSVVVQGSAASEVVLGAYRVGYELFETRYRTKPLEIFADCGLLDPDVLQRPQVQFILNAEIDAQLHGGGLTPGALIAAVRSLCLHGEEKSLMPGSQPKAYFWYKGLVAVLKDLGWSREELEPSKGWLQNRWDELTERCDLFELAWGLRIPPSRCVILSQAQASKAAALAVSAPFPAEATWNCCSGMIQPLLGKDLRIESEHWVQWESRVKPKPDPGRLLGNVNSSSRQMGNVAPLKGSYGKGGDATAQGKAVMRSNMGLGANQLLVSSFADKGLELREYYAAACGHCQALAPAWKAAQSAYSGPVTFRQIECNDQNWNPVPENADLCKDVRAFPTIKMFKDGEEISDYDGNRSSESLVNFAKDHEQTSFDSTRAELPMVTCMAKGISHGKFTYSEQNPWTEKSATCEIEMMYSSAEEIAALVLRLTNGGLWKAATKSLLLKTGICGYASCHGAAEKAGKLAKELDACDILDLTFVSQKCPWPADVTKLWEEHACASSPEGPVVLPVSQVMRFMEALVYDLEEKREESGVEVRRFLPLSPFSESMEDLAWQKESGRSTGLWHVQPSGRRKLRGLWLELVIQVFDVMDCIPTDLDLFFQCQEATKTIGDVSFMLQLDKFKEWLKRDYFSQLTDCTFNQFKVIVHDMLKCHIPEKALMEQVFEACPVIPDDDKAPNAKHVEMDISQATAFVAPSTQPGHLRATAPGQVATRSSGHGHVGGSPLLGLGAFAMAAAAARKVRAPRATTLRASTVDEYIAENDVIAFITPTCPFCREAVAALTDAGYPPVTVEVSPGSDLRNELASKTNSTSVPKVWVKGNFVGGCNDGGMGGVKPLLRSGKIQELMS